MRYRFATAGRTLTHIAPICPAANSTNTAARCRMDNDRPTDTLAIPPPTQQANITTVNAISAAVYLPVAIRDTPSRNSQIKTAMAVQNTKIGSAAEAPNAVYRCRRPSVTTIGTI